MLIALRPLCKLLKVFLLLVVSLALLVVTGNFVNEQILVVTGNFVNEKIFNRLNRDYEEDEDVDILCKFPKLDPWDPSIKPYLYHAPVLRCSRTQPYLTLINDDGQLLINETEMAILMHVDMFTDIVCHYRTFERGHTDTTIRYDKPMVLVGPVTLATSMVEVSCSATNDKGTSVPDFYFNLHAHPSKKTDKTFSKPTENQLSVLLMTIDSVSYSMLKRNMPKTYEFVTERMGMIMMERFNKVGDNTAPNMAAVLLGQRLFTEQDDMPKDVDVAFKNKPAERLPYIWRDFSEKGYATVFNEDRPDIGLLSVKELKGFSRPFFDYFYSPYWRALQADFKHRNLSFFTTDCFRNTPNGDLFVDLTRRHVAKTRNYLQFIYSFFVYYSHENDGVMIENADETYANFLRETLERNHLNRTIVLFMADHGQRFSQMRNTLIGLLEERNPFLGIWFPDWFYRTNPHIKRNLFKNRQRLTTSFDVYETLKHILSGNFAAGTTPNGDQRAYSLLTPVPKDRTCYKAGIPRQYCLCLDQKSLNASLPFLEHVAKGLVEHLNYLLEELGELCHKITLDSVERAESLELDERVKVGQRKFDVDHKQRNLQKNNTRLFDRLRITVQTQPRDALFEGVMVKRGTRWTVDGEVQRINAYGNTSDCIKHSLLRKYCTCRSL